MLKAGNWLTSMLNIQLNSTDLYAAQYYILSPLKCIDWPVTGDCRSSHDVALRDAWLSGRPFAAQQHTNHPLSSGDLEQAWQIGYVHFETNIAN